ncbi:7-cyano-7-deazaguanine synthase QueC [Ectothiorhodospiraceae bacterium BW-2]|nr:7-cyano-7-deazaguanine synthase QueC [Ectothiorhodospiraceae bacterium BW-2]
MKQAVVILSGGQDSTTCLYWALSRWERTQLTALTFDYGQRHRAELHAARQIAALAGVSHLELPLNTFAALGGTALTEASIAVEPPTTGLPNTFVPGRNLIFLTFAAALAWQQGAHHLVTGVAQTDYSGYPDCRQPTIAAQQRALQLGLEYDITIHTPLMELTKAETVTLAQQLGAMEALAWSHSCYNGSIPPCGHCAACQLRAAGFATAGVVDPLRQRLGLTP